MAIPKPLPRRPCCGLTLSYRMAESHSTPQKKMCTVAASADKHARYPALATGSSAYLTA